MSKIFTVMDATYTVQLYIVHVSSGDKKKKFNI